LGGAFSKKNFFFKEAGKRAARPFLTGVENTDAGLERLKNTLSQMQ
jgi:hypothetical protein